MIKYFYIISILMTSILGSCISINPYHCPATTDQRYRDMNYQDKKHLDRKPNKYKRRAPSYNQQEGLGEDFDYKLQ